MNPAENGTTKENVITQPKCPHCDKRIHLGASVVPFGPLEAAVFFCGYCHRVVSISVLPLHPGAQTAEVRRSGIILPGEM